MAQNTISVKEKIIYWFTSHPWLKLISLVLAILVWFYVSGELMRFNY